MHWLPVSVCFSLLLFYFEPAFSARRKWDEKRFNPKVVQSDKQSSLQKSPYKAAGVGAKYSLQKAYKVPSIKAQSSLQKAPKDAGIAVKSSFGSVSVNCGESDMVISINRDFFSNGHFVSQSDLLLGPPPASISCTPITNISNPSEFILVVALEACGSSVMMTNDSLVYANQLVYNPPGDGVIVRSNGAVVPIECHYMRLQNVSSNAIKPTWVPFTSTESATDVLSFSLQLMSDSSTRRTSNVYYLNDPVLIEASVSTENQTPLRLFIDSCVATLSNGTSSNPSYSIIENDGCLLDSTYLDSTSAFITPRSQPNKLLFSFQAFRFYANPQNLIYITCHLKVTTLNQTPDSLYKACFFSQANNSWYAVEGDPVICACCQSSNCAESAYIRYRRDLKQLDKTEFDVSIGPIAIQDVPRKSFVGMGPQLSTSELHEPTDQGLAASGLAVGMTGTLMVIIACLVAFARFTYRKH
ncbi:zona pellucida sperm-binding protein 3-like [Erpetoichthys calabaricus]|uniref:zona pellucida sperm-binding protein 3-like n=1 Tax=Erpetoichthys calabaricus TaxID=27687 RepID=UPI0022345508|nr:zona pellucida sperm-binding protein 3-like [Erpetoichthys calabaricus]